MPLVGLAAMIVALYIFKKNWNRSKILDQKKIIVELIKEIHEAVLHIEFANWENRADGSGIGSSSFIYSVTLFQIGDLLSNTEGHKIYDSEIVYLGKDIDQIIDFNKYIVNPNTPLNISEILVNFYHPSYHQASLRDIENKTYFIRIRKNIYGETLPLGPDFKYINAIAYKSYLSFKQCCFELEKELKKWNKKNNVGIQIRKPE